MYKLNNIYIGIVVNNQDWENRGRVQVFIPHLSNTLYKGWNESGEDIKFKSFDSSVFTPDIVSRLTDVLPWAEMAAPFFGGGTGAPVNQDTYTPTPAPTYNTQLLDESGVPKQATSKDYSTISNVPWSAGFISAMATSSDPNFPANGSHAGYVNAIKSGRVSGWVSLNPNTTTPQVGDIIVKTRVGGSHGDIVVGTNADGSVSVVGGNVSNKVKQFDQRSNRGVYSIIRPTNPTVASNMAQKAKAEADLWSSNNWDEKSIGAFNRLASYYDAGRTLPKLTGSPYTSTTKQEFPKLDGMNSSTGEVGNQDKQNVASSTGLYSDNLLSFIKQKEGYSSTAYKDGSQYSIGYGTVAKSPNEVIDETEANLRLKKEIDQAANMANKELQKRGITNLTQSQKEALYSYTYNRGLGGTKQLLNNSSNSWDDISKNMVKYWGSNQSAKNGLINRRNAEVAYANSNGENINNNGSNIIKPTTIFQNAGNGVAKIGGAGTAMGMFSIPQVGAKAYVMFLDGNPLKPIVVGSYQEPSNVRAS